VGSCGESRFSGKEAAGIVPAENVRSFKKLELLPKTVPEISAGNGVIAQKSIILHTFLNLDCILFLALI